MGYIGSQPATNFETVRKQVSTTNSGTTITLDYSVSSVQDILVTVNAVVQSYDNYSVSGTTLTLGGTLNNDRVEILYVGRTFQTVTPAVGTVTNDMLANSSITLNGSAVSLGGSATLSSTMTPSFHAYSPNSFQAIANATATTVNVSNERFDSDSAFNTSTKRFTPQTAGKYFVYGNVVRDGNWSAYARLYLAKNGNASGGETLSNHSDDSGGNGGVHVSGIIDMNGSSDYVELLVRQDSGGSLNLWNSGQLNFFGGFRVLL